MQLQYPSEWAGDTPVFLVCIPHNDEDAAVIIDLDLSGWIETHKELFRTPGTWYLGGKAAGRPIFCVLMGEGDQFFYTKRHVGDLMGGREVTAIGIGKKRADGVPVNLWLMPDGTVCGGDDVDEVASRMI